VYYQQIFYDDLLEQHKPITYWLIFACITLLRNILMRTAIKNGLTRTKNEGKSCVR